MGRPKSATSSGNLVSQVQTAKLPHSLQELLSLSQSNLAAVDLAVLNSLCAEGLPGAENRDIAQVQTHLDQWAQWVKKVQQDLVGAWVGLSEDQAHYVRLELEPAGHGRIAVVFLTDKVNAFRIDRWDYRDERVALGTTPLGASPLKIRFSGKALSAQEISIEMSGRDWRKLCSLRKEAELLARDRIARDSLRTTK